ncbi:MAG TPA: hypothetical protein VHS78_09365 [Candidatus Elarobacter sp.]|jgi:hypothetical protein|nr:hypothetical protein [Candidatus Elarobacter sp.]
MRFLLALVFALAGVCLLAPTAANAQATRTWVSGTGDDANPCSRTAPCKTFAGAISKTTAAGEINCIDSGGYGALTITKPIAIKCDNTEAGVLVSGTNGFVINAASTDIIYLSGLDFEGLGAASGNASLNGIDILSAAVVSVVNCVSRGFTSANGTDGNGIFMGNAGTTKLFVTNTILADNSNVGLEVKPQGGATSLVEVQESAAVTNTTGYRANDTANGTTINMTLSNSVAHGNAGAGVNATGGSGTTQVTALHDAFTNNGTGLISNNANTTIRVGYSTISGNGVATSGTGTVNSYGNNQINANGTDTTPVVIPLH